MIRGRRRKSSTRSTLERRKRGTRNTIGKWPEFLETNAMWRY